MKAKLKSLIILAVIFVLTLTAGIIAGCSIGELTPDERAKERGMTSTVTYYANGGTFDDNQQCYMCFRFKAGQPIFNIGEDKRTGQEFTIKKDNFIFAGWQYCELKDGLPILTDEETGEVCKVKDITGTAEIIGANGREKAESKKKFTALSNGQYVFVDGNHPVIGENEHLYLVATWIPDVKIEYRLASDTKTVNFAKLNEEGEPVYENGKLVEEKVNNGDVIAYKDFDGNEIELMPMDSSIFRTSSTHSYIHLYYDEECTEIVEPSARAKKPESKNYVVYAKFIFGEWTPVRDSSDVNTMLRAYGSSKNFFIVNDINYTGPYTSEKLAIFDGVIDGNGKCITGLTVSRSSVSNDGEVSLFGKIGANAEIKNLTLKNVSVTAASNRRIRVYALFTKVTEGAKITGVTVDGISVSVTMPADAGIINIPLLSDGSYKTDNWLYGRYGKDNDENLDRTDAEFEEIYPGLEVLNATLKINNDVIV